jgi:hypothetical protein
MAFLMAEAGPELPSITNPSRSAYGRWSAITPVTAITRGKRAG